jgi:hypothetical protein
VNFCISCFDDRGGDRTRVQSVSIAIHRACSNSAFDLSQAGTNHSLKSAKRVLGEIVAIDDDDDEEEEEDADADDGADDDANDNQNVTSSNILS